MKILYLSLTIIVTNLSPMSTRVEDTNPKVTRVEDTNPPQGINQ